jgi:hypothetical protein
MSHVGPLAHLEERMLYTHEVPRSKRGRVMDGLLAQMVERRADNTEVLRSILR